MRTFLGLALTILGMPAVLGCTPGETETQVVDDGITDVRVPIPEPDPAFIDFVTGEAVIEPGTEKMLCTHFRYDGPEAAFDLLDSIQGQFGHHAVLLGAKVPMEPGTVEECTKVVDMDNYEAYTIGDEELPAGYGVFLPSGKTMVLQAHYLNTSDKPIRIRDVVRLRTVPLESIVEWAAIYVTNHLNFKLPPSQTTIVEFDCFVEQDVKLLLAGGHMHEHGTRVELKYGPDEASLQTLFNIDPWFAEYRDNAPVELFFENPLPFPQGTLLRTRCEFNNPTPAEITFPEEMCVSFGYAAGRKEPTVCNVEN